MNTRDADGGLDEQLDVLFRRECIHGELKIARFGLITCAVSAIFILITAVWVDSTLAAQLTWIPAGYTLYYGLAWLALKRGWVRPWIRYASCTLEVSAASMVALVDAATISAAYAFTSSPNNLYFVAIFLSVLRFRPGLALYAGGLAACQSAGLYYLLGGDLPADLIAEMPSLGPTIFLQRSGYLLVAGVVAASTTWTARRLLRSVAGEAQKRLHIHRLFGRYVSPEAAEEILRQDATTSGQAREVSVLCSDIRGFTAHSAKTPPEEVVAFLNRLFGLQHDIVSRHGGRVDKYLGDGMLAIFGAPIPLADHTRAAAAAALEIAAISADQVPAAPKELQLGVAVHTGSVVVGSIGGAARMEFTAIGDTVNLAFRIEGLNSRLGTKVLVSEEARAVLGEEATVEEQPATEVRGREEPIRVFSLTAMSDKAASG